MASAAEITLSQQERSELERRAAKLTLPYRDVQRAKLVLYAADGLSNTEIAVVLRCAPRSLVSGGEDSRPIAWRVWQIKRGRVARVVFPPEQVAEVKAVACEPPAQEDVPLSRRSVADVHRLVIERGICEVSVSTIVRWLAEDAIRPWQYRSWIFPTAPDFAVNAGRILDLYQGRWDGELLHPGDMIVSADEKPSIQARGRIAPTLPPTAGVPRGQRVEHTYERNGALTYLAAWDVRRGGVIGRCEPKGGIEPFGRLVEQVMTAEPYASARRVFWIVDNGSSHRGQRSVERLQDQWPTLRLVHTPVHASWLNQIEIYFSIVQRKVLTPNDFEDLDQVKRRLAGFERLYNEIAEPFAWNFTRDKMNAWLARLNARAAESASLAA